MLQRLNLFFYAMKGAKKDIMGARNVSVVVGENNKSGNDFMDNLYDLRLSMFSN
jgi:hypothetical protein